MFDVVQKNTNRSSYQNISSVGTDSEFKNEKLHKVSPSK
jgi:hypothetical protein